MDHFENKLPDPSRKTWDEPASAKPAYPGNGCVRRGRPLVGRAFVAAAKNTLTHYHIFRTRESSIVHESAWSVSPYATFYSGAERFPNAKVAGSLFQHTFGMELKSH
jgi:hypothetical protein